MGITDFFSDLLSSVSFVQDVQAEAPADDKEDSEEGGEDKEGGDDDDKKEGDDGEGEGDGDEAEEEGGDDEEEEEEEEEEEPVDPKPLLEEGTPPFPSPPPSHLCGQNGIREKLQCRPFSVTIHEHC
jgi:ubiquinol-cytochrome c reductase subunit 6